MKFSRILFIRLRRTSCSYPKSYYSIYYYRYIHTNIEQIYTKCVCATESGRVRFWTACDILHIVSPSSSNAWMHHVLQIFIVGYKRRRKKKKRKNGRKRFMSVSLSEWLAWNGFYQCENDVVVVVDTFLFSHLRHLHMHSIGHNGVYTSCTMAFIRHAIHHLYMYNVHSNVSIYTQFHTTPFEMKYKPISNWMLFIWTHRNVKLKLLVHAYRL